MSRLSLGSAPRAFLLVLLTILPSSSRSQLTISSSTTSACLNEWVSLSCFHPELVNNSMTGKYAANTPGWMENGVPLVVAPWYAAATAISLMNSSLTIFLENNYFAGRSSMSYTCSLLLAPFGKGGAESSEEAVITVKQVEAVTVTAISTAPSDLYVQWSASQDECRTGYYVTLHRAPVQPAVAEAALVGAEVTKYTFSTPASRWYSVLVTATGVMNATGPTVSSPIEIGFPTPSDSDTPPCMNGNLVLECVIGANPGNSSYQGRITSYQWIAGSSLISSNSTGFTLSDSDRRLVIDDVSTLERQSVTCSVVVGAGTTITGSPYIVTTLTQPQDFTASVESVSSGAITLAWSTTFRCFGSQTFTLHVTWNEVGNATTDSTMATESPYRLEGLRDNTTYQVAVRAVGSSGAETQSVALAASTKEAILTKPLPVTEPFPVLAVVLPVLIVLLALVVIVMVVALCFVRRKSKNGTYQIEDTMAWSAHKPSKPTSPTEPGPTHTTC